MSFFNIFDAFNDDTPKPEPKPKPKNEPKTEAEWLAHAANIPLPDSEDSDDDEPEFIGKSEKPWHTGPIIEVMDEDEDSGFDSNTNEFIPRTSRPYVNGPRNPRIRGTQLDAPEERLMIDYPSHYSLPPREPRPYRGGEYDGPEKWEKRRLMLDWPIPQATNERDESDDGGFLPGGFAGGSGNGGGAGANESGGGVFGGLGAGIASGLGAVGSGLGNFASGLFGTGAPARPTPEQDSGGQGGNLIDFEDEDVIRPGVLADLTGDVTYNDGTVNGTGKHTFFPENDYEPPPIGAQPWNTLSVQDIMAQRQELDAEDTEDESEFGQDDEDDGGESDADENVLTRAFDREFGEDETSQSGALSPRPSLNDLQDSTRAEADYNQYLRDMGAEPLDESEEDQQEESPQIQKPLTKAQKAKAAAEALRNQKLGWAGQCAAHGQDECGTDENCRWYNDQCRPVCKNTYVGSKEECAALGCVHLKYDQSIKRHQCKKGRE